MKPTKRILTGAALVGMMLATSNLSIAQETVQAVTTTTTSAGTITEFGPKTLVLRTEASPEPIRYVYSKTTTYVDETGAPVSLETVKSGLPVTVYYTRTGDRMVASKVIVRRAVVSPAVVAPTVPLIEEKKTTTTTTTTSDK